MAQATRTFRIFVSSTFSDLREERNALQKYVFPRLRELCARHGCSFQAIDLRWGVREEAAVDQQTLRICMEEIGRCQRVTPKPNFIVLLGDRYGWRPLPFAIPADEFEAIEAHVSDTNENALLHCWYKRDDNAVPPVYDLRPREREFKDSARWEPVEQRLRVILVAATTGMAANKRLKYVASATEQEIVLGAMEVADAASHVFGFFRTIGGVPHGATAADFIDVDEHGKLDTAAAEQLRKLKERLRSLLPGNIHDYEANWQDGAPTTDNIGALPTDLDACLALNQHPNPPRTLCVDIWRRLSQVLLDQIAQIEAADPLDKEIGDHRSWGEERAKFFTGRATVLRVVEAYVAGTERHPLVVSGTSGSGKTALLGRAVADCGSPNGAQVIFRFIGATPSSSDGRVLLESLCRQIARLYGAEQTGIPAEYNALIREFWKRLSLATPDKPIVLFLDALDQLSDASQARNLAWIPVELPAHVRLVVSTISGDCLSVLERKLPPPSFIELPPMPNDEGAQLLDLWLSEAKRVLQPDQRNEVLSKFSHIMLPLYLKLAFEEARRWRSYTHPDECHLSSDVPRLIGHMFERLCDDANHGYLMVSRALGYLCAAWRGLSEEELLDVLSRDKEVLDDFQSRAKHPLTEQRLPVVVWSRLYFDLEPYLTKRNASGTTVLAFYHQQVTAVAMEEYLSERTAYVRTNAAILAMLRETLHACLHNGMKPDNGLLDGLSYHACEAELFDELEGIRETAGLIGIDEISPYEVRIRLPADPARVLTIPRNAPYGLFCRPIRATFRLASGADCNIRVYEGSDFQGSWCLPDYILAGHIIEIDARYDCDRIIRLRFRRGGGGYFQELERDYTGAAVADREGP